MRNEKSIHGLYGLYCPTSNLATGVYKRPRGCTLYLYWLYSVLGLYSHNPLVLAKLKKCVKLFRNTDFSMFSC